jgi:hypothetical protein
LAERLPVEPRYSQEIGGIAAAGMGRGENEGRGKLSRGEHLDRRTPAAIVEISVAFAHRRPDLASRIRQGDVTVITLDSLRRSNRKCADPGALLAPRGPEAKFLGGCVQTGADAA